MTHHNYSQYGHHYFQVLRALCISVERLYGREGALYLNLGRGGRQKYNCLLEVRHIFVPPGD